VKIISTFLTSLVVVLFSACSSGNVNPEVNSVLENSKISTYLIGKYITPEEAQSKLEIAGFEVVAKYKSVKKGITLVFTNDALKAEAAKPGRAYAAVSRLFIDNKEKMISFTNPVYFGKAFMQDQYNHKVFNSVLETINEAFPGLRPSKDELAFDALSKYQFMIGMPYYNDTEKLGKLNSSNSKAVDKAYAYKKGKLVVFEIKLSDTSTLMGYDLGRRTKKFVKKIGRENAAILPYCIAIENGQAEALNPKYYIALSYPLLDMGGFMDIAAVPGAIIKDLEKAFKK